MTVRREEKHFVYSVVPECKLTLFGNVHNPLGGSNGAKCNFIKTKYTSDAESLYSLLTFIILEHWFIGKTFHLTWIFLK